METYLKRDGRIWWNISFKLGWHPRLSTCSLYYIPRSRQKNAAFSFVYIHFLSWQNKTARPTHNHVFTSFPRLCDGRRETTDPSCWARTLKNLSTEFSNIILTLGLMEILHQSPDLDPWRCNVSRIDISKQGTTEGTKNCLFYKPRSLSHLNFFNSSPAFSCFACMQYI